MSTSERARRIAERLEARLAEIEFPLEEMDRRLGWKEGRTASLLRRGEGLRMSDLLRMLEAAGLEERSFFASVFGLPAQAPTRRDGEIPYSTGKLSDEDVADFPPAEEVISLVRSLVGQENVAPKGQARRRVPPLDEPDLRPSPEPPDRGRRGR